jgi:hypothetical protein
MSDASVSSFLSGNSQKKIISEYAKMNDINNINNDDELKKVVGL